MADTVFHYITVYVLEICVVCNYNVTLNSVQLPPHVIAVSSLAIFCTGISCLERENHKRET